MEIRIHGGYCCGIKHIHNMGSSPLTTLSARSALSGDATSYGRHPVTGVNDGHPETYSEDFFCEEAPIEDAGARLERLIAFIKAKRPHGIIEVVVTSNQSAWYPRLEALGFTKVSEAKNSNTGNLLRVFHLVH